MNKATIFQAAVAVTLFGLFLMLAGATPRPAPPVPAKSLRPATETEQRDWERQRLIEEMDRLWEQRQAR